VSKSDIRRHKIFTPKRSKGASSYLKNLTSVEQSYPLFHRSGSGRRNKCHNCWLSKLRIFHLRQEVFVVLSKSRWPDLSGCRCEILRFYLERINVLQLIPVFQVNTTTNMFSYLKSILQTSPKNSNSRKINPMNHSMLSTAQKTEKIICVRDSGLCNSDLWNALIKSWRGSAVTISCTGKKRSPSKCCTIQALKTILNTISVRK